MPDYYHGTSMTKGSPMKHILLPLLALPLAAGAPAKPGAPSAQVKRGAYLTAIMGCADCHTPMKMGSHGPEPDMSLAFSGHPAAMKLPPAGLKAPWMWAGAATNTAFAGPWGVSFSANLTPDKTGLGEWTPDMFVKAIKTGKHLGKGRPILPPMPQPAFSHATDEDLRAIFAYLRTLQPIENKVPDPIDPTPAPASGTH